MQLPGMDFADPEGPSVSTDLREILSWEKYLYFKEEEWKIFIAPLLS